MGTFFNHFDPFHFVGNLILMVEWLQATPLLGLCIVFLEVAQVLVPLSEQQLILRPLHLLELVQWA